MASTRPMAVRGRAPARLGRALPSRAWWSRASEVAAERFDDRGEVLLGRSLEVGVGRVGEDPADVEVGLAEAKEEDLQVVVPQWHVELLAGHLGDRDLLAILVEGVV